MEKKIDFGEVGCISAHYTTTAVHTNRFLAYYHMEKYGRPELNIIVCYITLHQPIDVSDFAEN